MAVASDFAFLRTTVTFLAYLYGLAIPQTSKQTSCVVEDIGTPSMPACVIQSIHSPILTVRHLTMHDGSATFVACIARRSPHPSLHSGSLFTLRGRL
jgi:hypothetical protein